MRFFVLKLKYVKLALFSAAAAAAVLFVCLTSGRPVTTFLVNNREIPIYSVEREDNKVALTFDSAWNDDDIDEIISILRSYNCGATFFVTGKWAEDYSTSLNKLFHEGFEVGIHSYNHDDYTQLSKEEIVKDMEKCDAAIQRVTGLKPLLVRTPSGAYDDNAVRTIEGSGRMCIQWSVDGLDYTETTESEIYNRVISKTGAGDIILMHNGTALTAKVLPQILEQLCRDFEVVSVSELIYKDNFTIDNTGRQRPERLY